MSHAKHIVGVFPRQNNRAGVMERALLSSPQLHKSPNVKRSTSGNVIEVATVDLMCHIHHECW